MIKNYLKIALRHLMKNKPIAMVNIMCLIAGMAGAILIGLFVVDELEYDQHFAFKDRIYRLTSTYQNSGNIHYSAQTPASIVPRLLQQFPEVENATRVLPADEGFIFSGDAVFKEKITYTDSAFASVFDLRLSLGNKRTCLKNPSSIIINETTAAKLFGPDWWQSDIIGKTLAVDGRIPLEITGVFRDLPNHTHLNSNMFASVPSGFEDWMNEKSVVYSYVLMRQSSNTNDLTRKLETSFSKTSLEDGLAKINLQNITSIHLSSSFDDENAVVGNIRNIYALILVAVFIMITTVSNFACLYTAGSFNRLKEVGLRKAVGALGNQIRYQFLAETLLTTIIAGAGALIVVACLLPMFNEVTGKKLLVSNLLHETILYFIAGLVLTTSLLAGIHPSVYLSTTRTTEALKGVNKGMTKGMGWRKGLIVLEFSTSAIMIVLSIVAYKQIRLINGKNLGFDKDNSIALANPYMLGSIDKILSFKNELLTIPGVDHVSVTGYTPSQNRWVNSKITSPNRDLNSVYTQVANWLTVDAGFIQTMDMKLVAGRNFLGDHDLDKEAIIINEKAAHEFKLNAGGKSAIGAELSFKDGEGESYQHFTVIGIVADFNFGSLHEPVKPMIMKLGYHRFEMAVRLSPTYQKEQLIRQIEIMWTKKLPSVPFEYYFIKDRYDYLHRSDIAASNVFSFFCLLTVILSGLGLFSMVAYTIIKRTKEIGIRKLLGASECSIVVLLTRQYATLIVISYLLALPVASKLSDKWLADFAFRTEISWWVYISSGLILTAVTVGTVGYQTVKAAWTKPVDNLRYE